MSISFIIIFQNLMSDTTTGYHIRMLLFGNGGGGNLRVLETFGERERACQGREEKDRGREGTKLYHIIWERSIISILVQKAMVLE
jgi:hypothetical protein